MATKPKAKASVPAKAKPSREAANLEALKKLAESIRSAERTANSYWREYLKMRQAHGEQRAEAQRYLRYYEHYDQLKTHRYFELNRAPTLSPAAAFVKIDLRWPQLEARMSVNFRADLDSLRDLLGVEYPDNAGPYP